MAKYYYREHMIGYQRLWAKGKMAWAEVHGATGFDDFASRAFLEAALPRLSFEASPPRALEYGCGTGPGACFLARRGFQVDAIDIVPLAIQMARRIARERNLDICYWVQDVCELPHNGAQYDLIVDSYCLQGIVTDADREAVFAAVRARLKPEGYYLISSAIFDPGRYSESERVLDLKTGVAYHTYGEASLFDPRTSIVYVELEESPAEYEDAIQIEGKWYLPNRKHRTPQALNAELQAVGFDVCYQDGGNMICVLSESPEG